jgi:hypothetical protein
MRPFVLILLSISVCGVAALGDGKDPRDGSSYERAIIVPPQTERYVEWEWDLLQKRFFDGHAMPKEHALLEHGGRIYDRFVFSTRDGDKIMIFDVTSFHPNLAEDLREK